MGSSISSAIPFAVRFRLPAVTMWRSLRNPRAYLDVRTITSTAETRSGCKRGRSHSYGQRESHRNTHKGIYSGILEGHARLCEIRLRGVAWPSDKKGQTTVVMMEMCLRHVKKSYRRGRSPLSTSYGRGRAWTGGGSGIAAISTGSIPFVSHNFDIVLPLLEQPI